VSDQSVKSVSPVVQDYLKAIWNAEEWSDHPVTIKELADRLAVRMSTVSEQVRKLANAGLLVHERYGAIELTDKGRRLAVGMARRHRLIETFLVSHLGYTWDQVHDEAEVLEHAVSDAFVDRLDTFLGHPARDPHGDPIPSPSGLVSESSRVLLTDLVAGEWATVVRIDDSDSQTLRHLASVGLGLDTVLRLTAHDQPTGMFAVQLGECSTVVSVPEHEARAIRVAPGR